MASAMDAGEEQPTAGRFDGIEHRFPVRVYFEDTDRSDMLRLAGVDQRAAWEAGEGAYAIAELSIRYLAPARLDDALVVASRLGRVRSASLVVHQRVSRGTVMLADACVTAALVAPSGRPRRQPPGWLAAFRRLVAPQEMQ